MHDKISFLKDELLRTTEWLKFAEQKFTLIATYYALWITFMFANTKSLLGIFNVKNNFLWKVQVFLFVGFILSLLIGIYFLFKVIFPKLENLSTNKSLFYYGHIAEMKIIDFMKEMKKATEITKIEGYIEQIHTNAVITNAKMLNIQNSARCLFINLGFLILLAFIL